jgi:hypothetical protein
MLVKIWALSQDVVIDQSDIDYCKNNDIQLDSPASEHQRIETMGRVYHYRSAVGFVKLTTFDEKSECMLQLRYADKISLWSQVQIDSATYSYQ